MISENYNLYKWLDKINCIFLTKVLDNNFQREKVSDRTSAIIFVLGFQPRAQHPQPEGEVAASLLISLDNNQETDENETY